MTIRAALRASLARVNRPLEFCTTVVGPDVLPGLQLAGHGTVALPLDEAEALALAAHGVPAAYGKGTRTVVDPAVRRVLRFPADRITFANPAWRRWLDAAVGTIADTLGLAGMGLTAQVHELLLYRPGDFFLPHRDGEKTPGMVATLSVQLPSTFQGGGIVIRHQGSEVRYTGDDPAQAFVPQAVAWYADCEHEILPVDTGHRLVLIANLVLPPGRPLVAAPDRTTGVAELQRHLTAWLRSADGQSRPLVIPMQHAYSQEGLRPTWLKGTDRAQAQALLEAAHQVGAEAYLALVTYRVVGDASHEDEDDDPDTMDMGDIITDDLTADGWVDAAGHVVPLGEIDLHEEDFLDGYERMTAEVARQEFEGYTGNAGMELTRWYHRAAIVLWPADLTATLLGSAGVERLLTVVEHGLAQSASPAISRLMAATLDRWLLQGRGGYEPLRPGRMAKVLAKVGDLAASQRYLGELLQRDPEEQPAPGLPDLLARFDAQGLAPSLTRAWQAGTVKSLERDAALLVAAAATTHLHHAIRTVAPGLIDRFLALQSASPKIQTRILQDLVAALTQVGDAVLTQRLIDGLHEAQVDPATVQADVLLAMGQDPVWRAWAPARTWRERVLATLAKAQPPRAPETHARAGLPECDCPACVALDAFLRDPLRAQERFPLREERRRHLEDIIATYRCDLTTTTERRGSPHRLVATKTTASHQRAIACHRHAQQQRARLVALGN